jgi:hypothetical protein
MWESAASHSGKARQYLLEAIHSKTSCAIQVDAESPNLDLAFSALDADGWRCCLSFVWIICHAKGCCSDAVRLVAIANVVS